MKKVSMGLLTLVLFCLSQVAMATPQSEAAAEKAIADTAKTNASNASDNAGLDWAAMTSSKETFITAYATWKAAHMGMNNPTIETMKNAVISDEAMGNMGWNSANSDTVTGNSKYTQNAYNAGLGAMPPFADMLFNTAKFNWAAASVSYGFAFIEWNDAAGYFDDARQGYDDMTAYLAAHP